MPASGVPGCCWLSAPLLSQQVRAAGVAFISSEEFVYERPRSGPRRRVVIRALA
jgi:hypothetical protein